LGQFPVFPNVALLRYLVCATALFHRQVLRRRPISDRITALNTPLIASACGGICRIK
jgi:hypothetical protein